MKQVLYTLLFSFFSTLIIAQNKDLSLIQVDLNINSYKNQLFAAPLESISGAIPLEIELPMPSGSYSSFRALESPIMSEEMAKNNPEIRTYALESVIEPSYSGRLTIAPEGVFALLLSPIGMIGIYPNDFTRSGKHTVELGTSNTLLNDFQETGDFCGVLERDNIRNTPTSTSRSGISHGTNYKTYRLAIVATGEFTTHNGGTVGSATTIITNSVNSVQAIYENELSVKFSLLTPVVYTNAGSDPFVNNQSRTNQAQTQVDASFGNGNYDVGHVFHNTSSGGFDGGGVAGLGVVCNSGNKGAGWSGSSNNTTNGWIGLAAHEFGHMFGANHTFNGSGGSCTTNIASGNSYEIGSGNTIMSYQGICDAAQNIPSNGASDNYFNAASLDEMVTYINNNAGCAVMTTSNNSVPTANANPGGGTITIPKSTPFELTGVSTDANGDALSYCWEQHDEDGAGTPTIGFIGATAAASTIAPLFRSYPPSTSPTRYFPQMSDIVAGNYATSFEPLPTVGRTINMRLTVRDNRAGGGAINCSDVAVTVNGATGPYTVTAPNGGETWSAGSSRTFTWNVSGTNAFCNTVDISLSIDGGAVSKDSSNKKTFISL